MSDLLNKIVEALKKIPLLRALSRIPALASSYHYALSFLAALAYGFPSRRLTVIGVTGTKGKTTVCSLIWQILNGAGKKCGMVTTAQIAIGDHVRANDTKQTMLGRLELQRLLREMVVAHCTHAVVETSSEGIVQHRHRFIEYRTAVFTNLTPEHIERHGGFENYRAAKVRLFEQVARRHDGGVGIYNMDDPEVGQFLAPNVLRQYRYSLNSNLKVALSPEIKNLFVTNLVLRPDRSSFVAGGIEIEIPLLGEFNVRNAAAAICVGLAEGIPLQRAKEILARARSVPGRAEIIKSKRGFRVIVDYAHEPASLEAIYNAAKLFKPKKLICLLGSQGGGRDVWKRGAMGKIAGEHCDLVVLSNEDPYEEDPTAIIEDIVKGTKEVGAKSVYKIIDRRKGIEKAFSLAKKGDVVVLTGKGGEVWMCLENDRKIPWNESAIVKELLP